MKNNNYYAGGNTNAGYNDASAAYGGGQPGYGVPGYGYGAGGGVPVPAAPAAGGMDFDIGRLLKRLYRHWFILLALWLCFSAIGLYQASKKSLTFYSSGMLSVGDDSGRGGAAAAMTGMGQGGANSSSQREVLRSTDLACEVIRANGLNANLSSPQLETAKKIAFRPLFFEWWRYSPPITKYQKGLLVTNSNTKEGYYYGVTYKLEFTKSDTFKVYNGMGEFLRTETVGKPVKMDEAEFTLTALDCPMEPGDTVFVSITPDFLNVGGFLGRLQVNPLGNPMQPSNLIHIGYSADSPFVAKRVVDSVMAIYTEHSLKDSRASSQKVANYVAKLMGEVAVDLQNATVALQNEQKEMGQFSLDPAIQKLNDRMGQAEVNKVAIARNLERIKAVADVLKTADGAKDDRSLIELEAMGDTDVRTAIAVYRGAQAQFQQRKATLPSGRPALADAEAAQAKAWDTLGFVVQVKIDQLQKDADRADREIKDATVEFAKFPEQQRHFADLVRKVNVHQKNYDRLFEEKTSTDLALAGVLANCSIKSQAYPSLSPSDPTWAKEIPSSLSFSLVFAALIVMLPGLRIRWFETAEEAAKAVVQPVFAVLPSTGQKSRRGESKVLVQDPNSRWSESMRLLRTNLLQAMAGKPSQVLMISGAQPGDGKSTVAANLAASLAQSARVKSVLLIDADMHRPSLHGVFGTPQSPGLSDYLNGNATIDQVLHEVAVPGAEGRTVAFIPAGPIPPVPSDLIDTEAMQALLAYARERHTFTVLDTPPYPLVSVAGALAEHVDRVLTVCRIGRTSRGLYLRHVTSLARHGAQIGQIFNSPAAGRMGSAQDGYGYGYGYGYGKDGYGYVSTDKPSASARKEAAQTPPSAS